MASRPYGPGMSSVRELLTDLEGELRERSSRASEIEGAFESAQREAQGAFESATKGTRAARDREVSAAQSAHDETVREAESSLGSELRETESKLATGLRSLKERVAAKRRAIEKDAKEATWLSETVAESDDRQSVSRHEAITERVGRQRDRLKRLLDHGAQVGREMRSPSFRVDATADNASFDRELAVFSERTAAERASASGADADDAWLEERPSGFDATNPDDLASFAEHELSEAEGLYGSASALRLPGVARGAGFVFVAGALVVVGGAVGFVAGGMEAGTWLLVGLGAGAALVAPVKLLFMRVVDRSAASLSSRASAALTRASIAIERAAEAGERRRAAEQREIAERTTRETAEAEAKRAQRRQRLDEEHERRRKAIEEPLRAKAEDLREELKRVRSEAERAQASRQSAAEEAFEQASSGAAEMRDAAVSAAEDERDAALDALRAHWAERSAEFARRIDALTRARDELLCDWNEPEVLSPDRDDRVADHAAFGELPIDLASFEGGLPEAGGSFSWDGPRRFRLPTMLEFPVVGSLFIRCGGAEREAGLDVMRAGMMRIITTLPPGKARFTIVDPVGLGQSFAAFMHLADADDQLVAGRIWTEPRHIEQRLLDLTEHMENVIQKYLRNEFETIEQYNERAGEIAEPYRFLVLADFPTNLTDVAARRLASIASSGARCGVHMLVLASGREEAPRGVSLDDLAGASVVVLPDDEERETESDSAMRIDDAVLRRYAFEPARLPSPDRMTALLREVGRRSVDASQVRVPFAAVAPGEGEAWTGRSAEDVRVPLGRSGANRLQELNLGHGTLQHALIAGKTGSGKSTLLHVLITNASLWYSPEELELYLVDFKKGVEFKTYAGRGFPHARVVAIETDREFGLSVLRRVDEELQRRGGLFRDAHAQHVPGYREASGESMPRVLLVIDEFQELFVEDDRIAQEAALLLDRLVRQGRAFGVHVILGSQTLGGAYSLARTTMSQMNVRIALQCDEQDSYLILSEDNGAARLLSRPGEAIYNDAGGKLEGNSPFQIVWLPEGARQDALGEIARLAEQRHVEAEPTIVFEGNVPADASRNGALVRLARGEEIEGPQRLYLGEPTAIAEPINVPLFRRGGQNIVMVGQQDETADALLAMAGASFAVANAGVSNAAMYVLDGTPKELAETEALRDVVEAAPVTTRFGGVRDAEALLVEVAAEVDRRRMLESVSEPGVLVLVNALHRFRDLRKSDDFGFSSFSSDDEGSSPEPLDKVFARIVEQGPEVGVHVAVWCDTATNLERSIDRRLMKEFDTRVLFQMGAMDSTGLIDSPAASKLGANRAIIASEEAGSVRTFRPYRRPDPEWLSQVFSTERSESGAAEG